MGCQKYSNQSMSIADLVCCRVRRRIQVTVLVTVELIAQVIPAKHSQGRGLQYKFSKSDIDSSLQKISRYSLVPPAGDGTKAVSLSEQWPQLPSTCSLSQSVRQKFAIYVYLCVHITYIDFSLVFHWRHCCLQFINLAFYVAPNVYEYQYGCMHLSVKFTSKSSS